MGKVFGEFLRQLREDRNMTLRNVEESAHISNAYLSQVESGQRNIPTLRILSKLADVYGVPVSLLIERAEAELKEQAASEKEKAPIPAPDTEFICRGYEKLSEDNKQALKKFLEHLRKE